VTSAERELQRVVERWRSLPLDHALSRMPAVQAVVQALADAVAEVDGRPRVAVPDLGPRVVMDQLTVMVFDAVQAGLDPKAELVELRHKLARTRATEG
jgi:hypothetical protein